jgi:hypothetical protein
MEIHFRNSYTSRVWVAIQFWYPDHCGDYGSWGTRGWWGIDPGGEVHALDTANNYGYFYAQAADGSYWAGDHGPIYLYHEAFDSCLKIGSTAAYDTASAREFDLNNNDVVTVNLTA